MTIRASISVLCSSASSGDVNSGAGFVPLLLSCHARSFVWALLRSDFGFLACFVLLAPGCFLKWTAGNAPYSAASLCSPQDEKYSATRLRKGSAANVSQSATIARCLRARVIATFSLRGSARKPTCRSRLTRRSELRLEIPRCVYWSEPETIQLPPAHGLENHRQCAPASQLVGERIRESACEQVGWG